MNHWHQLCKCGHRKGGHGIRGVGHCPVRLCLKHNLVLCKDPFCLRLYSSNVCPCENFEKAEVSSDGKQGT